MLNKYRKVKLSKPSEHRTGLLKEQLPKNIEQICEELNWQVMRLGKALKRIKPVAEQRGKLVIFYDESMIGLKVGGYPWPQGYKLLNFEYMG